MVNDQEYTKNGMVKPALAKRLHAIAQLLENSFLKVRALPAASACDHRGKGNQNMQKGERKKACCSCHRDPLHKMSGEGSKPVFIHRAEAFEEESHNGAETCRQIRI